MRLSVRFLLCIFPPSLSSSSSSFLLWQESQPKTRQVIMAVLHEYDYVFAIGTLFAMLDAYNNGASEW